MDEAGRRRWILSRLDAEARALAASDPQTKPVLWGRVLAMLEIGVRFGWWTRAAADRYSEAARNRCRITPASQSLRRSPRASTS